MISGGAGWGSADALGGAVMLRGLQTLGAGGKPAINIIDVVADGAVPELRETRAAPLLAPAGQGSRAEAQDLCNLSGGERVGHGGDSLLWCGGDTIRSITSLRG